MSRLEALCKNDNICIRTNRPGRHDTGQVPQQEHILINGASQLVFYVGQDRNFSMKACLGSQRSFTVHLYDSSLNEVLVMKKGCTAHICKVFCCCGLEKVKVYNTDGTYLGMVEEICSLCTPEFQVFNADGDVIYNISIINASCGWKRADQIFTVSSMEGDEVGNITNKAVPFLQIGSNNVDLYSITFPKDADPIMRGIILSAAYLIDILYYDLW